MFSLLNLRASTLPAHLDFCPSPRRPIAFITFRPSETLPSERAPFPLRIRLRYPFPLRTHTGSRPYNTDPRYVHPREPFCTHADARK